MTEFLNYEGDDEMIAYVSEKMDLILAKGCETYPEVLEFVRLAMAHGLDHAPVGFLMQSAYMQGITDLVGMLQKDDVDPQVARFAKLALGGREFVSKEKEDRPNPGDN